MGASRRPSLTQRSLANSLRRRRNSFQSLTTQCWGSISIHQRPVRNSSLSYHTDLLQTAVVINLAVGAIELHQSSCDSVQQAVDARQLAPNITRCTELVGLYSMSRAIARCTQFSV